MVPEPSLVQRFSKNLDALIAPGERVGVAVSGGPDSLALLLLAAAARPGLIEAATVDHRLRPESAAEAQMVAGLCAGLRVPHAILAARWTDPPSSAIQERARDERYRLLGEWLVERSLPGLATAHHADDQAETIVMRLNRGAGVRGLAAMRPLGRVPGSDLPLLRPLLGWRRAELEQVCAAAGLEPAADPSNLDLHYERVRVRRDISEVGWLDPAAVARSAAHLAGADEALDWAAEQVWKRSVTETAGEIVYRRGDEPGEIVRRIVARAIATLRQEGPGQALRGSEVGRLIAALEADRSATLRGVQCAGGSGWHFSRARGRKKSDIDHSGPLSDSTCG
jgi:tRNA(Ile)-lysidine synthase